MGIIREILGIFKPKILAENIIKANEDSYYTLRTNHPGKNEHWYLAHTYVTRKQAGAIVERQRFNEDELIIEAFSATKDFSVLDPPDSIRTLALYTLSIERPDILANILADEFVRLMHPVYDSQEKGTFEDWYKRKNPV